MCIAQELTRYKPVLTPLNLYCCWATLGKCTMDIHVLWTVVTPIRFAKCMENKSHIW